MIVQCQHCGNELLREKPNPLGSTCFICKKNRKDHYIKPTQRMVKRWVCACEDWHTLTEDYCAGCLIFKKDVGRIRLKMKLPKQIKLKKKKIKKIECKGRGYVHKLLPKNCSEPECTWKEAHHRYGYFRGKNYYCPRHA